MATQIETNGGTMALNVYIQPAVALIAGILILVRPGLLPYIVAIYLIIVGILGLIGGVRA